MRALIFDGARLKLERNFPAPILQKGEAVIHPLRMGICATDLEITRGLGQFAGVLGHEFVGVVAAVADDLPEATRLMGHRVVGTICATCHACDRCRSGMPQHCRHRTVLGISGRDGCFAEEFKLPVENLLLVPDSVTDDQAVFVEPLAAAYRILEQITVPPDAAVTVLGDGRLGLLCAQVLHRVSPATRCVGRDPDKVTPCAAWGIERLIAGDLKAEQDQDVVVDCTGSAEGFELAQRLVKPMGTIVLKTTVAASAWKKPIDLTSVVVEEINIVGSRCGPFPRALAALQANEVDVLSLIHSRFDLADGLAAMEMAGRRGVLKVLLTRSDADDVLELVRNLSRLRGS